MGDDDDFEKLIPADVRAAMQAAVLFRRYETTTFEVERGYHTGFLVNDTDEAFEAAGKQARVWRNEAVHDLTEHLLANRHLLSDHPRWGKFYPDYDRRLADHDRDVVEGIVVATDLAALGRYEREFEGPEPGPETPPFGL